MQRYKKSRSFWEKNGINIYKIFISHANRGEEVFAISDYVAKIQKDFENDAFQAEKDIKDSILLG